MYTKWNCHIMEYDNVINSLLKSKKEYYSLEANIKENSIDNIKPLDINCSLGDQIKYYREIKNIKQKDLAKELNIDRYTLHCIENKKSKIIFYPETINKVIDKLEIKDKLIWNDSYEEYIIKNNRNIFKEFRTKYNLTIKQLSKLLNEHISAIGTWERKNTIISRKKYYEILNKLNTITKEYIDNYFETDYTLFIKNNPHKQIVDYINKENISLKEFSKRINRHEYTIKRLLKEKTLVSEDIYNQFIKLKERQDNNEIHSDEYIKFIKSGYPTIIKEMLKKK